MAGSACNVIPRPQSAPSIEDARLRELHEVLTGFAPEGEVLVVISNYTPILNGMLITWLDAVRRAKVKNYVIVAIDASIQEWCRCALAVGDE